MKIALSVLAVLLVGFAGTSWLALESGGGVAIVATRAPDGGLRETHVWFVERDGELWLEAGTPENSWYQDVLRDPQLTFHTDGREERYTAQPTEDRTRHAELRKQLRAKYGWRDRWVSIYVDQDRSLAVRLLPVGG